MSVLLMTLNNCFQTYSSLEQVAPDMVLSMGQIELFDI